MPVLSTDRDVDLAVAEVERQDLREAGVILEETQHRAAPVAPGELRLGQDVLKAVHVHLACANRVVLVEDPSKGPGDVGIGALFRGGRLVHFRRRRAMKNTQSKTARDDPAPLREFNR